MTYWEAWQLADSQAHFTSRQVRSLRFGSFSRAVLINFVAVSRRKACHCGSEFHVRNGGDMELCEKECLIACM